MTCAVPSTAGTARVGDVTAWLVVCGVVAAACITVLWAAAQVGRELPQARDALGALRRDLVPALVRLRDTSAAARVPRGEP